MIDMFAQGLFYILAIYFLIGFIFALFFVTRLVGKIDSSAKEGTWGFKALIIPGVIAFWPLLMQRWRKGLSDPPEEKNAHRTAACELHCLKKEVSV